MNDDTIQSGQNPEEEDRERTLSDLEEWLEKPMIVLSFVWLALLVVEVTWGLTRAVNWAFVSIWVIFILDFLVRFAVAPRKIPFVKRSWLTIISLVVPAFRVLRVAQAFRVFRAAGAVRGATLVRVVGSVNRSMRSLARTFERRGFGYVVVLTAVVTFGGAAGMFTFESGVPGSTITSYPAAVWWTAMIMTTMGTEYYPLTPEGRALCLLLAVYAFAMFGYVTATLATFFIGQDAEAEDAEVAGQESINVLTQEIRSLRDEVRVLAEGGR